MKTVITTSGNFVVVKEDEHEMPISRPYLNHCNLERRVEHRKDCEMYGISEYYNNTFLEGEFQGYDYGHDLGIKDPYAQEILESNVLDS